MTEIEISPDMGDIERAFIREKIDWPIVQFVRNQGNSDVYFDQKSKKEVVVSRIKAIADCPICAHRQRLIAELGKETHDRERLRYEKRESLRECPDCKGFKNNILSSSAKDIDFTAHTHTCGQCGKRFPENPDEVYSGRFISDELGQEEYGMTFVPKPFVRVPEKRVIEEEVVL